MKILELVVGLLVATLILGPLAAGAFHLGNHPTQTMESKRSS